MQRLSAEWQLWADAVEKVCGVRSARNNRMMVAAFLIRSCAFDARFESVLLRASPQNPFSTASTQSEDSCPSQTRPITEVLRLAAGAGRIARCWPCGVATDMLADSGQLMVAHQRRRFDAVGFAAFAAAVTGSCASA